MGGEWSHQCTSPVQADLVITVWFFFVSEYSAADISHSTENETVTVTFPLPLPPGKGLLCLDFNGELNDKLKGFYRCKYTGQDGKDNFCAVTHFEVRLCL